jgi:hypothetical protein
MNNDYESPFEREEQERIEKEDAEGQDKYYLTSGRRVSKWLYAIARFIDALEEMRTPEEKRLELTHYVPQAAPVKHSWLTSSK